MVEAWPHSRREPLLAFPLWRSGVNASPPGCPPAQPFELDQGLYLREHVAYVLYTQEMLDTVDALADCWLVEFAPSQETRVRALLPSK